MCMPHPAMPPPSVNSGLRERNVPGGLPSTFLRESVARWQAQQTTVCHETSLTCIKLRLDTCASSRITAAIVIEQSAHCSIGHACCHLKENRGEETNC